MFGGYWGLGGGTVMAVADMQDRGGVSTVEGYSGRGMMTVVGYHE